MVGLLIGQLCMFWHVIDGCLLSLVLTSPTCVAVVQLTHDSSTPLDVSMEQFPLRIHSICVANMANLDPTPSTSITSLSLAIVPLPSTTRESPWARRIKRKSQTFKLTSILSESCKKIDDDEDWTLPVDDLGLPYEQQVYRVTRNSCVDCNFILEPLIFFKILYKFLCTWCLWWER